VDSRGRVRVGVRLTSDKRGPTFFQMRE
jgi:hypothetical protein